MRLKLPRGSLRKPMKSIPLRTGLPRSVEVILSLLALIAAAPLVPLIVAALALSGEWPLLFRQQRVGSKGRIFVLYKFRTMRNGIGGPQVTASGDARITGVGRILRKTKLDELPEFWNVLKGEMSLVGPRPEVPRYVDMTNQQWQLVLQARPGITDPVTLRLRNEEELLAELKGDHERFYLEVLQPIKLQGYVQYLSQRSWREDLMILWRTCLIVVFPRRISGRTVQDFLVPSRGGNKTSL
jgi:lipopolysaccharide/colanic/teichoic acid biosynthesis glycosyltransferase